MTRINSAISVAKLTDEHLLAEHREIKRLPYYLTKAILSGIVKRIPSSFTLGKGHVTFFLDKQHFLYRRYHSIQEELRKRGFNPTDFSENWNAVIDGKYWNDHTPTENEKNMLIERIIQRLIESKKKSWHYYREEVTKKEATCLLI